MTDPIDDGLKYSRCDCCGDEVLTACGPSWDIVCDKCVYCECGKKKDTGEQFCEECWEE